MDESRIIDLNNVQTEAPDCSTCIHTSVCGIKATMLQAVAMTVSMNPVAEEFGATFANSYANGVKCVHYLTGDNGR